MITQGIKTIKVRFMDIASIKSQTIRKYNIVLLYYLGCRDELKLKTIKI